ncbi:Eco47II family restriction endonuclease [Flavobacterium sp.]|uniref:Eco47II family restriction endonuclease n=1 Tax=Flavobacterium sp. TaxID=239 RepID=UPI003751B34D
MKNKYVDFISDEHLLNCIANLHKAYLKAKNNITKKNFYSNKVDTIKLTFDAQFNNINQESLIQAEILRQIDKSINNSIGTFHEQILGGIQGFQVGNLSGYDIKSNDGTLFAILNFESLSQNIEEGIFEKLCNDAQFNKIASYYYVDFSSKNDSLEKWVIGNEESSESHKRVFKTSGNKFYQLLTGNEDALSSLQSKLPIVIRDYLKLPV